MLDAIERLNYKPNAIARQFVNQCTTMLGVLVGDLSNPCYAQMAQVVERAAFRFGYTTMFCNIEGEQEIAVTGVDTLLAHLAAALTGPDAPTAAFVSNDIGAIAPIEACGARRHRPSGRELASPRDRRPSAANEEDPKHMHHTRRGPSSRPSGPGASVRSAPLSDGMTRLVRRAPLSAGMTRLVRRAPLSAGMTRFARRQAWLSLAAASLALLATGTAQAAQTTQTAQATRAMRAAHTSHAAHTAPKLPPVGHVFVIVLENQNYASTFGDPSADPYLARTLPRQGALLKDYYGTGHFSNDNYISLVSGQPPNPLTQADCTTFVNFTGAVTLSKGVQGGSGCVYPSSVANIATQLSAKGLSWKAYEEDMGNDPKREAAACGHPAVGSPDNTLIAAAGDGYATRHDPFVYFHSVINNRSYCDKHIVALGSPTGKLPGAAIRGETGLATDLKQTSTTPAFSFITPNLCNDGHDYPCTNQRGGASALADIDRFLQTWVPKIAHSPAFRRNGMLEITFDESEGPTEDSSACCHELPGPAAPLPGIAGPGGGKIGAVLLSPFIKPQTVTSKPYNHYSSLATWELLFGLHRLADAATVPTTFGTDVFTDAPKR